MPRSQGAIPSAKRESDKPIAPADLWERLDAAVTASKIIFRPPNTFTTAEFEDRYKLTHDIAQKRIQKLMRQDRVRKVGRVGNQTYYELVEAKCSTK